MLNFEEFTDWYYFVEGQIYFSKRCNMRKAFQADVIFAKKDDLFICAKNRYDNQFGNLAFITRKGFIDYVQSLHNNIPSIGYFGTIAFTLPESTYYVNENSPIHLIKNRWE